MIRNNSSPHQTIVGVVTDSGQCDMFFAQALAESVKVGFAQNIVITPVFLRSTGNAMMRYNQLITMAWKEGVDDLLFVAPDCYWQPQAMVDLIHSSKDVVALPVATSTGFQVQMGELPRLQTDEKSGEIKVLWAGMSFFRLSKDTLKKLCETHPTIEYGGEEVKLVIQNGDIYGGFASPAEVLVYRLKEAGFEIWLNPKHTVNTVTTQPVEADFAAALKEAKGE